MHTLDASKRSWTLLGLAIALFSLPAVVAVFNAWQVPWTASNVTLRELTIFAFVAALAFIIRRKEGLGWDSVGLQRPPLGSTALWVLLTIVGLAVAIALSLGLIQLLGLQMGSEDAAKFDALPTWVILLVIVRAGFVEEFFTRGYAIERLQGLTGSLWVAVIVPLLLFAVFHYRQGWAGIIIALLTGAVLTAVYVCKRNLWIGIITHFLGDFIPNIVLPLFISD